MGAFFVSERAFLMTSEFGCSGIQRQEGILSSLLECSNRLWLTCRPYRVKERRKKIIIACETPNARWLCRSTHEVKETEPKQVPCSLVIGVLSALKRRKMQITPNAGRRHPNGANSDCASSKNNQKNASGNPYKIRSMRSKLNIGDIIFVFPLAGSRREVTKSLRSISGLFSCKGCGQPFVAPFCFVKLTSSWPRSCKIHV